MFEMILDKHLLFVLMGVLTVVGIISKFVVGISLKKLTLAASNMGQSTHPLMKLVRAKFEHACMVSDKVQNVEVFVEKYIYEYRILGISLHRWRRLERAGAWGCAILGVLAALMEYVVRGMSDVVIQNACLGIGLGIALFLLRVLTDEEYRMDMTRTYMVDYLENVCAHRYEKIKNRKELKPQPEKEEDFLDSLPEENLAAEQEMFSGVTKAFDRMFEMDEDQVKDQKITEDEREQILKNSLEEECVKKEPMKKAETVKKTPVQRVTRRKETPAEKPQNPVSKEAAIREILEEFLA